MNLIEVPFGPITATKAKTLQVEHRIFDRQLKREVVRKTLVTGSDAFGLPRPIDDQVLVGMQALTYEAGYQDRRVCFSRYQLCRILGWKADGRAYKRLEESFDRIAGTTLKFSSAWWDKADQHWKSTTFHLIDEVNLCSRDELDRTRGKRGGATHRLCSFVWSDVVWKSFQDGYIKSLDMQLFREISRGRRREVPLRLYRILDKRFYRRNSVEFELRRLCVGTLGLASSYSPSQMQRILERAADCLKACGFLEGMRFRTSPRKGKQLVVFYRRTPTTQRHAGHVARQPARNYELLPTSAQSPQRQELREQLRGFNESDLYRWESSALQSSYGTKLERQLVSAERESGKLVTTSGAVRQHFIARYIAEQTGKPQQRA
jgi:hypothetical protein